MAKHIFPLMSLKVKHPFENALCAFCDNNYFGTLIIMPFSVYDVQLWRVGGAHFVYMLIVCNLCRLLIIQSPNSPPKHTYYLLNYKFQFLNSTCFSWLYCIWLCVKFEMY